MTAADLVAHRRVDVVFGSAAGRISFDAETFDEVDDQVVDAFDGKH